MSVLDRANRQYIKAQEAYKEAVFEGDRIDAIEQLYTLYKAQTLTSSEFIQVKQICLLTHDGPSIAKIMTYLAKLWRKHILETCEFNAAKQGIIQRLKHHASRYDTFIIREIKATVTLYQEHLISFEELRQVVVPRINIPKQIHRLTFWNHNHRFEYSLRILADFRKYQIVNQKQFVAYFKSLLRNHFPYPLREGSNWSLEYHKKCMHTLDFYHHIDKVKFGLCRMVVYASRNEHESCRLIKRITILGDLIFKVKYYQDGHRTKMFVSD